MYFYPAHKPPPPSGRRRLILQLEILRLSLFKPLGYLPLKCLPQTWTARINDRHTSYFAEAPCFLALQRWSSSAYRYRREHLSASRWAPPLTDNEVMLYSIKWHWKGGCNHERKCCIPRIKPPPPLHFVLRLRLQKGRGVFARHYGKCQYRLSQSHFGARSAQFSQKYMSRRVFEKILCS